jgi:hypothetical protein
MLYKLKQKEIWISHFLQFFIVSPHFEAFTLRTEGYARSGGYDLEIQTPVILFVKSLPG